MEYPTLFVQMLLSVASVIIFVYALAELSLATQHEYKKEHPSFSWFLMGALVFMLSRIIGLISLVISSDFWSFLAQVIELGAFILLIIAFSEHLNKHKEDAVKKK